MPRGQADYGMYAPTRTIGSLSDMAELAVRLGSIATFDRRGRVVLIDDFEASKLKWLSLASGGATAMLDSTEAKSGSQGVALSVINAMLSVVTLSKFFVPLPSNRIGSEISFTRPNSNGYFTITLSKYDGINVFDGALRFDFDVGAITYLDSDGNYQTFVTGLSLSKTFLTYHTAKLVVDFDTLKYVRCLYANEEYDLSSYALCPIPSALEGANAATFSLLHRVQAAVTMYIDDFILTMEEP